MLELDTLFANEGATTVPNLPNEAKRPEMSAAQGNEPVLGGGNTPEVGHSGHNGDAPVFGDVCPRNSLQHKALAELGTVGTMGTVDLQGGDNETDYRAPGGGADRDDFALHPSAVILLIAYCRAVNIPCREQAESIIELGKLSPGEQVRMWQQACINKGMEPWRLLTIPASLEGHDCSLCAHLLTRQYVGNSGRRQFHWACGKGYLILETGRGTERIWIAAPECQSFERWRPGSESTAMVTYKSDLLTR